MRRMPSKQYQQRWFDLHEGSLFHRVNGRALYRLVDNNVGSSRVRIVHAKTGKGYWKTFDEFTDTWVRADS